MAKFSQIVVRTVAMISQTVVGSALAWMPASAAERSRSVSEILDVCDTFVPGYPQQFEPTTQIRIVD
jgi:hypothetical protein